MATPKVKLTKKMKCIQVNKAVSRSQLTFAMDISQGEKGPQARQVASFNFSDAKEVEGFEPDKEYTITITE